MKKISLLLILLFTFLLTSCNLPGSDNEPILNPDDAMATEIVRILTGTPVQLEPEPTTENKQVEKTQEVKPTEPEIEVETLEPTPAPTDVPAPTPTATLVANDPTRDLGEPTWVDNMNNSDNWPPGYNEFTTIEFKDGFLKLGARTEYDGWRVSWPIIDDFYLESTVQTPACKNDDRFGMIFRGTVDAKTSKIYMFGLTCDGKYSLRRWDGSTMHALVAWTAHDAIQAGPDKVNKLGVMARGEDIALYINGQKVNNVKDSNYLEGKFGFFVGGNNVENLTLWVDQVRYWINP